MELGRDHNLHAAIEILHLGHCAGGFIHLEAMRDEVAQRESVLEFLKQLHAGGIAARGMIAHSDQAQLPRRNMVRIEGDATDIGKDALAALRDPDIPALGIVSPGAIEDAGTARNLVNELRLAQRPGKALVILKMGSGSV